MKEIVARSLIAVVGFLIGYLLMAFTVGNLDTTQWTIDQRSLIAISEAILIIMVSSFPFEITK